jgi:hypothetical protein
MKRAKYRREKAFIEDKQPDEGRKAVNKVGG